MTFDEYTDDLELVKKVLLKQQGINREARYKFFTEVIVAVLVAGLVGFSIYKNFTVGSIIFGAVIFIVFLGQLLNYFNNRAADKLATIKILQGLMSEQQEFYFNRITYLQDLLKGVEPAIAHAVNDIPKPRAVEEPKTGLADIGTLEDVPVTFISPHGERYE